MKLPLSLLSLSYCQWNSLAVASPGRKWRIIAQSLVKKCAYTSRNKITPFDHFHWCFQQFFLPDPFILAVSSESHRYRPFLLCTNHSGRFIGFKRLKTKVHILLIFFVWIIVNSLGTFHKHEYEMRKRQMHPYNINIVLLF